MKQILIQLKPITVNRCWQGRRFKTKQYVKWRDDFGLLLKDKKTIEGNISVTLELYIKHDKTTDCDNTIKPILDALKENGVIKDDRFITEIHAYKYHSEKEFIRITLQTL